MSVNLIDKTVNKPILQPSNTPKEGNQKHLTDNFQTKVRNASDMNDCISVPRTIFKGYLGIMFGTSIGALAQLVKPPKIKAAMNATAIGLSTYGTWAFARPYVVKDAVDTVTINNNNK